MSSERHAFVLRIWTEDEAQAGIRPLTLRGSLHVVENGQTIFFNSLEMLPTLLLPFVYQKKETDEATTKPQSTPSRKKMERSKNESDNT